MEIKIAFFCILIFLCTMAPAQPHIPSPTITNLASNNMDFAMNLYRKIASYHDNNIFFAPLSISTVFAILSLAADGATREEIMKGLHLYQLEQVDQPELIPKLFQHLQKNITQNGLLKLDQTTDVFVCRQFQILNTFNNQIKMFFNADINKLDFADTKSSISFINDFIKNKTGNKVTDMISDLDALTQLLLINTVFFQGEWQFPFNPENTENGSFYIDNYNVIQVPTMFITAKFYTMEDDPLGAKVLKLPYNEGMAMLIVLPNKGVDYTVIDDDINAQRFLFWVKRLKKVKLDVYMPKFKMEQSYFLQNILPDLGVSSVFSDSANLTKLSKNEHLKVTEVLHKAVIEVDETGTTASAATTSGIIPHSLPRTFTINRPFFFFIYHELTNSLLFMGRVIDPTKM